MDDAPMDAWLIAAVRTPFGRHRGGLSGVRVDDLAALPIAELLKRLPSLDPDRIDDVVLGDTNGAGEDNRNVARMAALLAGLPVTVPGTTVNRLCGSGGEAMVQAARALALGDAQLIVAGGVEGMSRAPFVLPKPDDALPRQMTLHQTTVGWRLVNPRFPETWTRSLGECAEQVAREYGIGRTEQDEWAVRSHRRAAAAWDAGLHDNYVLEVDGVKRDESVRPDTNTTTLGTLRAAFTTDGEVTAGNSAPINDGAIAVLMGTEAAAADLDVEPFGRVIASAVSALEPDRFAVAPVTAIARALRRAGKTVDDMVVVEINEAFAAMVLSCLHDMPDLDGNRDRVNPNGGALAYGHPLGASMPRVVVDLCRELRRRGGGVGVAACCIGVGQGLAVVCEV